MPVKLPKGFFIHKPYHDPERPWEDVYFIDTPYVAKTRVGRPQYRKEWMVAAHVISRRGRKPTQSQVDVALDHAREVHKSKNPRYWKTWIDERMMRL